MRGARRVGGEVAGDVGDQVHRAGLVVEADLAVRADRDDHQVRDRLAREEVQVRRARPGRARRVHRHEAARRRSRRRHVEHDRRDARRRDALGAGDLEVDDRTGADLGLRHTETRTGVHHPQRTQVAVGRTARVPDVVAGDVGDQVDGAVLVVEAHLAVDDRDRHQVRDGRAGHEVEVRRARAVGAVRVDRDEAALGGVGRGDVEDDRAHAGGGDAVRAGDLEDGLLAGADLGLRHAETHPGVHQTGRGDRLEGLGAGDGDGDGGRQGRAARSVRAADHDLMGAVTAHADGRAAHAARRRRGGHTVHEDLERADEGARRAGRPVHGDRAGRLVTRAGPGRPAAQRVDPELGVRRGRVAADGGQLRVEPVAGADGVEAVAVAGDGVELVRLALGERLPEVVALRGAGGERGLAGRVHPVLAELVRDDLAGRGERGARGRGGRRGVVAEDRDAGRLAVPAVGVRAEDGLVDAALTTLEDLAALVDEEVVAEVAPAVGLHVVDVQRPDDGVRVGAVVRDVRGVVHERGLDPARGQVDRALVVERLVGAPLGAGDDRGPRRAGRRAGDARRRGRRVVGGERGRRGAEGAGGRGGVLRAGVRGAGDRVLLRVDQVDAQSVRQLVAGGAVADPDLDAVGAVDPDGLGRAAGARAPAVQEGRVGLEVAPLAPGAVGGAARAGLNGALDLRRGVRPGHAHQVEGLGGGLGERRLAVTAVGQRELLDLAPDGSLTLACGVLRGGRVAGGGLRPHLGARDVLEAQDRGGGQCGAQCRATYSSARGATRSTSRFQVVSTPVGHDTPDRRHATGRQFDSCTGGWGPSRGAVPAGGRGGRTRQRAPHHRSGAGPSWELCRATRSNHRSSEELTW